MEVAFAVVYVLSLRTASAAAFCRSATTAAHALRFAMHSPRELAELCNGFVACKYSADELSSNLCTQPPSVSDVHATAMRKYVRRTCFTRLDVCCRFASSCRSISARRCANFFFRRASRRSCVLHRASATRHCREPSDGDRKAPAALRAGAPVPGDEHRPDCPALLYALPTCCQSGSHHRRQEPR